MIYRSDYDLIFQFQNSIPEEYACCYNYLIVIHKPFFMDAYMK